MAEDGRVKFYESSGQKRHFGDQVIEPHPLVPEPNEVVLAKRLERILEELSSEHEVSAIIYPAKVITDDGRAGSIAFSEGNEVIGSLSFKKQRILNTPAYYRGLPDEEKKEKNGLTNEKIKHFIRIRTRANV